MIPDDSIWSPTMNGIPDGQARFSPEAVARDYLRRLIANGKHKQAGNEARIHKLMKEAGEVQQVWNRLYHYSSKPDTWDHLAEELADVVICAYALAIAEGIDLEAAIQAKHTVLMRREKEDGR